MGYALITENLTKGRYSIEIDLGDANRNQRVAQLSALIANLNVRLTKAQIAEAQAQSLYDAARASLDAFINAWALSGQAIATGTPQGKEHEQLLKAAFFLSAQLQQAKSKVSSIKLLIAKQQRALTALQDLILIQSRNAWCVDLTENAAGYVATVEIPGESNLVLIKPGAPAWQSSDGALVAREVMDPNQAYFNAAILPGWQKYKPTFRRGEIIELNRAEHKASVSLATQESSAQQLPIDQFQTLNGVPVTYMTCHSGAFNIGDQVVVMFDGQNQENPRVIGFVESPKSCNWTCFYAFGGHALFGSAIPDLFDRILSETQLLRIKIDNGSWRDMYLDAIYTVDGTQFVYYDTLALAVASIQRLFSPTKGYTDYIQLSASALFPASTTRRIAELAVYSNGTLVCNVATTDFGLAGHVNYRSGGVATSGGIQLADGSSDAVYRLDYSLTATQTP